MIIMKGFMLTPVVFVVLFMIAFAISFHFFDTDKKTAEGIATEAFVKKKMVDVDKDLLAASAIAFNTVRENMEKDKTTVRNLIKDKINSAPELQSKGFTANLPDISDVGRHTKIDLNLQLSANYDKGVSVNSLVKYSVVIGHPYAVFWKHHDDFNRQRICTNYVQWGTCSFKAGTPNPSGKGWRIPPTCYCTSPVFRSTQLQADLNSLSGGFAWSSGGSAAMTCDASSHTTAKSASFSITVSDPLNSLIVGRSFSWGDSGSC